MHFIVTQVICTHHPFQSSRVGLRLSSDNVFWNDCIYQVIIIRPIDLFNDMAAILNSIVSKDIMGCPGGKLICISPRASHNNNRIQDGRHIVKKVYFVTRRKIMPRRRNHANKTSALNYVQKDRLRLDCGQSHFSLQIQWIRVFRIRCKAAMGTTRLANWT